MSEIIESYQEEESLQIPSESEIAYATCKGVSSDGMIVQFDGETQPSTKTFSFNVAGLFEVNDRVLMQKVNGEYVAMATIGKEQRGGGSEIEVIDNLNSTSTTDALSANQGRILNNKIPTFAHTTDRKTISNVPAYDGGSGTWTFSKSGYKLIAISVRSSIARVVVSAYLSDLNGSVGYSYYNTYSGSTSTNVNIGLTWVKE